MNDQLRKELLGYYTGAQTLSDLISLLASLDYGSNGGLSADEQDTLSLAELLAVEVTEDSMPEYFLKRAIGEILLQEFSANRTLAIYFEPDDYVISDTSTELFRERSGDRTPLIVDETTIQREWSVEGDVMFAPS